MSKLFNYFLKVIDKPQSTVIAAKIMYADHFCHINMFAIN